MSTSSLKLKIDNVISKIPDKLKGFFYSDLYLILMAVVMVASWALSFFGIFHILGIIYVILMVSLILIVLDDITPIIPLLFCVAFSIGDSSDLSMYIPFLPIFAPLIVAIVFHLFYYKPDKLRLGKLGIPQIIISIVMLVGGCTSISLARWTGALTYTLLLGVAVFFIYFAFYNYIKIRNNAKFDIYIGKTFLWMGMILSAQIIIYYLKYRVGIPVSEWLAKDWINLGWGIDNNVATLLLISAPMTLYLSTKMKFPPLYFILGIIQYLIIVLTFSRGGILFALITAPAVIICTIIKSPKKAFPIATLILLVVIGIIVFGVFFDSIKTMLSNIFADGLSSSSRIDLYKEALSCFAKHPFFGVGGGYEGAYMYDVNHVEGLPFYWFHSTLFQIVGGYGLLGIFAFGYMYYKKGKIIFADIKKDNFFLFTFLAFLGFELYSLIDTGTFVPIPMQMIIVILFSILEHRHIANKAKEEERKIIDLENAEYV